MLMDSEAEDNDEEDFDVVIDHDVVQVALIGRFLGINVKYLSVAQNISPELIRRFF